MYKLLGVAAVAGAGGVYGRYFAKLPPDDLMVLLVPLVIMALLVVWVLPDRDTAPTATMGKLLIGFIGVMVAWPDYMALQIPGLPWISFRRMFLAPMCLLFLVCLSTNSTFRKDLRETLDAEPILWKMLLAFVLTQIISIAGAAHPGQAVKNFINYQIAWTGVFFVAAYTFRNERLTLKALKLFFAACLIIGTVGILESINRGVLWNGHIPTFLQVDLETMAGTLMSDFRDGAYRTKSVYGQPLPFAEIIALITPVTLYFIFTATTVRRRAILIAANLLFLYVLTLPQSRLGLIGFLASHALFILVWSGRIWLRHKFSIVGPTITLAYPVLLIGLAGAVMSVGSLRDRVVGGKETIYSDQTRKIQKIVARGAILRNPVVGYGPRQAPLAIGQISFGRLTLDNYLLWIALDYGLIGFSLFYGMILLAIHRMFMIAIRGVEQNNNLALMALTFLTAFLLIKCVLSEDDNHSMLFIMLGMAAGIMWREKVASAQSATNNSLSARLSR